MKSIVHRITRRRALAGAAAGIALSVSRFPALGQQPAAAQQPAMDQKPSTSANATRTSLHQEIELNAAPKRIFNVLLDSKQFAAFTGMPATIDPNPGGAFNTFGGLIEGRAVEPRSYWTTQVFLKANSTTSTPVGTRTIGTRSRSISRRTNRSCALTRGLQSRFARLRRQVP